MTTKTTIKSLKEIKTYEELQAISPNFQEAYNELQKLISIISADSTSLDDSIKYHKVSQILYKYCHDFLEKTKLEIEEI